MSASAGPSFAARVWRGWASRAGLRRRTTAVVALVLLGGLALGGALLAAVFARAQVGALDSRLTTAQDVLRGLLETGQLPYPLPADPGLTAQVVDAQGAVLSASAGISRLVPVLPGAPAAPRQLTTRRTTLGGDLLRVGLRPAGYRGQPVTIVVAAPLADVEGAVAGLQRGVLVVVPVVALAGGAAAWVGVGSALRPVERLRVAAGGVLDVRSRTAPVLPVSPTGDEVERLGRTLNAMLGRLHAGDARQRAFVSDAAHELRSPLASALVQLEVALDAPPEPAEWPEVARGVLSDVERLRVLVDDLLVLSRLDAGGVRAPEPVDLAELAGDPAHGPVLVLGDPVDLVRAVDNLQANARRHARSVVRTTARVEDGLGVLVVEDDGDGVPEGDRERVFERWARLDDGRARDAGGAGLGLAITRAVAEAAGGTVQVDRSELGGARFALRLPLAPGARRGSVRLGPGPVEPGPVEPGPVEPGSVEPVQA